MNRIALLYLFLTASLSHGAEPVNIADLPAQYMCMVFTFDLDTADFTKSKSRQAYHFVDGTSWRLEALKENEKGFVLTFDGKQLRGSSPKIAATKPDVLDSISPVTQFPRFFNEVRKLPVIALRKANLEGMNCDRYTLQSGPTPMELWVHRDTRLPVQIIIRMSDSVVSIERQIWMPGPKAKDHIASTDLTLRFYSIYSDKLNERLKSSAPPQP